MVGIDYYKKIAKQLEKEAQHMVDYNYRKFEYHKPLTSISQKFIEIGDTYKKAGEIEDARKAYKKAMNYSTGPTLKGEIQNKMTKLSYTSTKKISHSKNSSFLEQLVKGIDKELKKIGFVFAIFSILSLISALFLLSFNLTGYTIFGMNQDSLRLIGTCLFICGLTFTFLYFKKKRKF